MTSQIIIRPEAPRDFVAIANLIQAAFQDMEHSDHTEHLLVERLRKSSAYVPELALVASLAEEIVGYILLSKITIVAENKQHGSLALAPVAVLPMHQRKGIGGMLIQRAHEAAQRLGHQSVILIGHEAYYPKFGYQRCSEFNITLPFPAPAENCMAIELVPDGLSGVLGMVNYPNAFFE